MTRFAELPREKLLQIIDNSWQALCVGRTEFESLYKQWNDSQHLHLPATAELLCRNPPPAPDRRTLGLSDLGQRYVTGYASADASQVPKVLLMMFGYSSEQLALSIAFHYRCCGCRYFVPFCDNTLKTQRDTVAGLLPHALRELLYDGTRDILPDACIPEIVDDPSTMGTNRICLARVDANCVCNEIQHTDEPSSVFQTLTQWIKNPPAPFDAEHWGIGVEVTGGQKTMDSGATAFASYYGLPAFYLDSEEYDPDLRRPHPRSTRCKILMLPAASFSHRTREAIIERCRSCDFAVARNLTSYVIESMKHINEPAHKSFGGSEFFARDDFAGLKTLRKLLRNSERFVDSAYAVPVEGRRSLANVLVEHEHPTKKFSPRGRIEELLACVGHVSDTGREWRVFFDYVADEFYRLKAILGQGVAAIAGRSDSGRNYREVLLAGLGLAELMLEAMVRFSGAVIGKQLKIFRIDKGKRKEVKLDLTGWQVDTLWHMDYEKKWMFVKTGRAQVSIKLHDKGGNPQLAWPNLKASHFEVHAELVAGTSTKLLESVPKGLWGSPYNAGSEWRNARNPITHMRAPLDPRTKAMAIEVVTTNLPGLIELLYRLLSNDLPIDCSAAKKQSGWLTWNGETSEWREQRRVPWAGREADMLRWLAIEPGTGVK